MTFLTWVGGSEKETSKRLFSWQLWYEYHPLDSEDLLCWYYRKKWFLWTTAGGQAAENHGDVWGLAWYLRWGIYTSISIWTHLQNSLATGRSTEFKDILPWNISQMIAKTVPISAKIVISYVMNSILIKGTVMQIEKALINYRLCISKVSWKFRIRTICNFAIIYPWNLLLS